MPGDRAGVDLARPASPMAEDKSVLHHGTHIFSWGRGDLGQLGTERDQSEPQPVLDACLSGLPSLATTSTATLRFQSDPLEQRLDNGRGVPQGLGASDTRHHTSCRALCIGLGGGSLPNFLSHHFPGLLVDAVELDPTVVTAATQCMGLPYSR